jgi:hypothetical protein
MPCRALLIGGTRFFRFFTQILPDSFSEALTCGNGHGILKAVFV